MNVAALTITPNSIHGDVVISVRSCTRSPTAVGSISQSHALEVYRKDLGCQTQDKHRQSKSVVVVNPTRSFKRKLIINIRKRKYFLLTNLWPQALLWHTSLVRWNIKCKTGLVDYLPLKPFSHGEVCQKMHILSMTNPKIKGLMILVKSSTENFCYHLQLIVPYKKPRAFTGTDDETDTFVTYLPKINPIFL